MEFYKNNIHYLGVVSEIFISILAQYEVQPDITIIRGISLDLLNHWRGDQRAAIGLTEARWQDLAYTGKALESQRWQSAPETPFGYAREAAARGISHTQMATLILDQWAAMQEASDKIEAAYVTAKSGIEGAGSVAEIEVVLSGLLGL